MVIFYTYLFISIHGRTLLIFMLSLTHLIMPIDNINTQTIFVVLFTSRLLLTWGRPLDASSSVSPRYSSATYSQLTTSPFLLQILYDDRPHLFLTRVWQVGKGACLAVEVPYHLPPPTAAVPHIIYNPIRAIIPYQPQGLGGNKKSITISPYCWY